MLLVKKSYRLKKLGPHPRLVFSYGLSETYNQWRVLIESLGRVSKLNPPPKSTNHNDLYKVYLFYLFILYNPH